MNLPKVTDISETDIGVQVIVEHVPVDPARPPRLNTQEKWVRARLAEAGVDVSLMKRTDVRTIGTETQWSFQPKSER